MQNNKDYFDQSLDEIKLLKYINEADPEDEHGMLRLFDYFYYKVRFSTVFLHAQPHTQPLTLTQVHLCFPTKLNKLRQSSHQAQSTDLSQVQGSWFVAKT